MNSKIEPAVGKHSLVLSRIIDAPRELVFQAWIDPKQMKKWWGPHGFTNPVCEIDARPGGKIKICMDSPEFPDHWVNGEFREIKKPERLVFVSSAFDDESGTGFESINTITLEEHHGKTKLTLHVVVTKLNPKFQIAVDHMHDGWSQSLDRLADEVEGYKTKDRELVISRLLNAPRELVFKVWTDPDHIKNWWGPDGFTNTIHKMDVKPGGEWNLVMHGPDGTDYKNKSIFKEIVKPERIVYDHISGPKFTATITFTAVGEKTLIRWSMLFESKESFEQTVRTFKADEGLKQNIEKLNQYVITQSLLTIN
jgi:uncharacterized protein YndB with AHSA1/START domain